MPATVVSNVDLPIEREDHIAEVRRQVKAMSQARGFDAFATAAITTAASELARNVWTHAGRGHVVCEEISDGARGGIRLEFRDQGPGISDLERALRGGHSTARSLGLGLSGSRRLVDEFHIESSPANGTVVRVVKWARY